MNDKLLTHFLELQEALNQKGISVILGGGMSLYVNLTYREVDSTRYPFNITVRPTNDLDVFLSAEIITSSKKYLDLKNVLEVNLGYSVVSEAKWFQFEKEIEIFGAKQKIKVDLLTPPPAEDDKNKVSIKAHRVRPKEASEIHAYLTKEAKGLEIGKIDVKIAESAVTIVSNFNYLIFKLHAFADRLNDESKDYGRHHALDIFYTIARMNQSDWENAQNHLKLHGAEDYLLRAIKIRKEFFSSREQLGIIRLAENKSFQADYEELTRFMEQFIKDMADLFPE